MDATIIDVDADIGAADKTGTDNAVLHIENTVSRRRTPTPDLEITWSWQPNAKLNVPQKQPQHRPLQRVQVIPATLQRPVKTVTEISSDSDVEMTTSTGQPIVPRKRRLPEQPVAGPSGNRTSEENTSNHGIWEAPPEGARVGPPGKAAVYQVSSHNVLTTPRKKKKRSAGKVPVVINLLDSDEDVPVTVNWDLPPTDMEVPMEVDDQDTDEEDYDVIHAGYNINDHSAWKPCPLHEDKEADDDTCDAMSRITEAAALVSLNADTALRKYATSHTTSRRTTHLPPRNARRGAKAAEMLLDPQYDWDWTKNTIATVHTHVPRSFDEFDSPTRIKLRHGPRARYANLRKTVHNHMLPGPVNSVSQSDGMIAIASCVLGQVDAGEEGSRIYNTDASLKIICGEKVVPLSGHCIDTPNGVRHHTVNEAQFDPLVSHRLVSCGHDGHAIIWNCVPAENGEQPLILKRHTYNNGAIPLGVSFKPKTSIFTIWDTTGNIRIHKSISQLFPERSVAPVEDPQPVQLTAWGRELSDKMLFATTASEVFNKPTGYHKAFDIESANTLFSIDNPASGECLDVNPRGDELALVTCGKEQSFDLSIYDIRSKPRRAARSIRLEKLPRWYEETAQNRTDLTINKCPSSINQVAYGPDGIYIALARSDNSIHVYDSRFLTRVLHKFRHASANEGTFDDAKYGVYKINWMEDRNTKKLTLISGGADGCVRLWDLSTDRSRLRPNGLVIGQSDAYVGWFSLGDQAKGERPLVLGDGAGSVVIRD